MFHISHRGASGYAPENTLAAFRQALAMGADGVELDVHACKSGELVVIHDDTVDRVTGGAGYVAEMTLRELRALQVMGTETIPTLEEVMRHLPDIHYFIEIKHDDAALLAAEQVEKHEKTTGNAGRNWLISFRHKALRNAARQYPFLQIGASFEILTPDSIVQAHGWGAKAILPHHRNFGPENLQEAHALGLQVICWTVNEVADIARLRALGVDGIISDYPDRLRRR